MACVGCLTGQKQINGMQEQYARKKPVQFSVGKSNPFEVARYNRLTTGKANPSPRAAAASRTKYNPYLRDAMKQLQQTSAPELTLQDPTQIEPQIAVEQETPQYYSQEITPDYQLLFNLYSLLGGNRGWKYAALQAGENEETISNLNNIAKTQVGTKRFNYNYSPNLILTQSEKKYYTDALGQNEISYDNIPQEYRSSIKPILADGGNINYLKFFMNYGK